MGFVRKFYSANMTNQILSHPQEQIEIFILLFSILATFQQTVGIVEVASMVDKSNRKMRQVGKSGNV